MTDRCIDLNADVGEIPALLADGAEEQLLQLVSSANIACGGHAGSEASMHAVVQLCRKHGVAIGAHPGYPDPEHFGRRSLQIEPARLEQSIRDQVMALDAVAQAAGGRLRHIKPHGALYNDAAGDPDLAACIARAVAPWKASVVLLGPAGSSLLDIWRELGFQAAAEAFADRAYEPDGKLRSRQLPGALLDDPDTAAAQALSLAAGARVQTSSGEWIPMSVETLCLHGDSPNALATAQRIRGAFAARGIRVAALGRA